MRSPALLAVVLFRSTVCFSVVPTVPSFSGSISMPKMSIFWPPSFTKSSSSLAIMRHTTRVPASVVAPVVTVTAVGSVLYDMGIYSSVPMP